MNLNEVEEVNELKATGVYVAGVTTNSKDREDLYDIFVDGKFTILNFFSIFK